MSTEAIKLLANVSPSATTLTTLYTCTASEAVVSHVTVCNRDSVAVTFRLSLAPNGIADAVNQYAYYDEAIPASGTKTFVTPSFSMDLNDVLRCYASTANLTFMVWGVEISDTPSAYSVGGVLSGTLPSPGFSDLSCVQAYNRKKTYGILFNGGGGTRAWGVNTSTVGSTFEVNDSDGVCTQFSTPASIGGAGGLSSGAWDEVQTRFNPKYYCKFKVSTDTTSQRMWIGFFSGVGIDADTPAQRMAAIRWSTVAGDTTFQLRTHDGATGNTIDTGVAVDLNIHELKLEFSGDGTSLTWTLDSATGTTTTNLPPVSGNLGHTEFIFATAASTRRLKLYQIYCEQDA
jgi:hypothetical protein